MIRHNNPTLALILGVVMGTATSFSSVFADDTEVFFGQVDADANPQPNVLFVLDTSASMNIQEDDDPDDNVPPVSRLQSMKQAMYNILDTSQNINVGIMRFNGRQFINQSVGGGGAVIFPVTDPATVVCTGSDCDDVTLTSRISNNDDDSEETVSDGNSRPEGNTLSIGESGSSSQLVGLRFGDLDIPRGVTITSATLEFVADNSQFSNSSLSIGVQASDDAAAFTSDTADLSDRALHQDKVDWQPESWINDRTYSSPDISSVLQQVVERDGWCSNNNLALIIEGSGQRDAKSFQRSSTQAPLLRVSYDPSSIPFTSSNCPFTLEAQVADGLDDVEMEVSSSQMRLTSNDLEMPFDEETGESQLIGVRFRDLDLPEGAIIDDAYLEFEVQTYQEEAIIIGIYAQLGNASVYTSNNRDLLRNRGYSSGLARRLPVAGRGQKIRLPNLQSIVQQSVDSQSWVNGGALAFVINEQNGEGFRDLKSFEGGYAPALHIEYRAGEDYFEQRRARTARDSMKQVISEIEAIGSTPIIDSYFEASQYFLGGDVRFGKTRGVSGAEHGYHRVSHPDSFTGGSIPSVTGCSRANYNSDACKNERITGDPVYSSPMIGSCQANHIVFLSDGEPSENTVAADIRSLTGVNSCESVNDPNGYKACGKELATWLQETDHNNNLRGPQNITTYTIGFNTDRLDSNGQPADTTLLRTMASNGRGKFFSANDALSLTGVFRSIVGSVATEDTSFVSPGATVSQFNRLQHRNDIYFAQFKPNSRPTWIGNLKKYKIGSNAAGDEIQIQDADGNPAIDERTGFFATTARSYWLPANESSDGSNVAEGGVSAELANKEDTGTGSRKVYTFTGANDALPSVLASSANTLSETNTSITDAMLGLQGSPGTTEERNAYRSNLLAWARGRDVLDNDGDSIINEIRPHIGDPMHSQPVIVNYPTPGTATQGEDGPVNSTVFVATNEGFLHAIDSETGEERFAFIPQELLSNLDLFYTDDAAQEHPYGLDGPLTFWHDDLNDNLEIDSGEKALLFIGMRRGGNNYYAIDVSERDNPKLAWVIRGGINGDEDFRELGQTWSAAIPTTIFFEGEARDVLIFGAGYDLNQDPENSDNNPTQNADDIGRGLFVVDLLTGQRLYAALGSSGSDLDIDDLDYSIPSNLRVIDINSDGLADQIYTGDMGGQVWRFDFAENHANSDTELLSGGVIADLNGASSTQHRRFYYEPDVALINQDGQRFLSISIGSGWRAHPLDAVIEDRFYMIRSNDVYAAPDFYGKQSSGLIGLNASYAPITESDLINVTNDINASTNDYGWYLELEDAGEKVISQSVTFNNTVVFSSYSPELDVDACSTAIGGGSVYALSIFNGAPTQNFEDDGGESDDGTTIRLSKADRRKALVHGGIAPDPTILITEKGVTTAIGPETFDFGFNNETVRTFWADVSED